MKLDKTFRIGATTLGKVLAIVALGALATAANANNGFFNTKYVNCDTPWGLTIQKAIAIADEGERIVVFGTCTENVNIDKGVTLDGRGTASIIPEDTALPTIRIAARDVTITGLTLEAPSTNSQIAITNQSLVTITDSQIGNAFSSITAAGGSMVTVVGSHIHGNSAGGIRVIESAVARIGYVSTLTGVELNANVIENNLHGVIFGRATGTVAGNQIINNQQVGVVSTRGSNIRVAGNEISGNVIGIVNSENSDTALAEGTDDPITGPVNSGVNIFESIRCTSGYLSGVIGPDFGVPGLNIEEACDNDLTP